MQIWQAIWDPKGELLLWAESSSGNSSNIKDCYPYTASTDQLIEKLTQIELSFGEQKQISLSIPSFNSQPLCSPHLNNSELNALEESETPFFRLWSFPAIPFDPLTALTLLTTSLEDSSLGVKLDDSFKFWVEATKLLLDLLARGKFIPSITRESGHFASRWQILITDENDQYRFDKLVECMPLISRSSTTGSNELLQSSQLLESFLNKCTDQLIRYFSKYKNLALSLYSSSPNAKSFTSLAWVSALTAENSLINAPAYELINLEQRLKHWGGSMLHSSKRHQLATCFRLLPPVFLPGEEINEKEIIWNVEFFLKSISDRETHISAEQVWNGDLGPLSQSDFTPEEIEEILLKDLGRACHVFPELKTALAHPYPHQVTLNTQQAHYFLRKTAVLLEQSGFEILYPNWWKQSKTHTGLHLKLHTENKGGSTNSSAQFLGMQQLVDFSWQVALGDKLLSIEEFKKLVDEKTPLVFVNGQWVELDEEKLYPTLEFLKKYSDSQRIKVIDALRLGHNLGFEETTLPVVGLSANGWLQQLLDGSSSSLETIAQPKGFIGDLRSYQLQGLSWLAFLSQTTIGGCLADDMGLGKTIQFLALLQYEREQAKLLQSAPVLPTLLIVPMSILDNWLREAHKFAPQLKTYLHHGPLRLTGAEFNSTVSDKDLVITTYSLAYRDFKSFAEIHWGRIALDEAQNIKNLESKQTQAIRRLVYQQIEKQDQTHICHRLALTGTPLENHLEELWSILDVLNPGYLGSISDFRSKFSVPIERYRDKQAAENLAKMIRPFVLRRVKTDPTIINDLPEKIEMEELTSLSEEQATLYQTVLNNMLPQVEQASGLHRKGLVLATITKLKQICDHPTLYLKDNSPLAGRSAKLQRVEQLLEEILAEKDKVLIFTQYAQMGHLLKNYLQDRFNTEVIYLHGGLSKSQRSKIVDRFQTEEGPRIFVLSLKAGGLGLNLTQANQVIHFDQWWNPAVQEQATDRAYRIGQKRNVQVRKLVCKGTLEENIAQMLKHKKDLADSIVNSTKNILTELSTDELRKILQLSVDLKLEEGDS